MTLDPIWHPGEEWPDTPDENLKEQAVIQIYSQQLGRGYITTVPTHGKTNPFIDCFDDNITWAYMRDIEAGLVEESRYWQQWAKEHRKQSEVPIEREAVAEPIQQVKQLSFDFG